jgi:A/G-specific adenine glycosylase
MRSEQNHLRVFELSHLSERLSPPQNRRILFLRRIAQKWAAKNGRHFPWRAETDPYRCLVTEVLLQRTRAAAVSNAWPSFMSEFPSPDILQGAADEAIASKIHTLGLYNKRLSALRSVASAFIASKVPTREILRFRKGLGNYSIDAYRLIACGSRAAPVDANVRRLLGRYMFGQNSLDADDAHTIMDVFLGRKDGKQRFFDFLDFAALVCSARSPKCGLCPAKCNCEFYKKRKA